MESDYLILRRASAFRPSSEWNDDDYDVLCNGAVVGRIMQATAVPVGHVVDVDASDITRTNTPTHGYAATRQAAMAATSFGSPRCFEGSSTNRLAVSFIVFG